MALSQARITLRPFSVSRLEYCMTSARHNSTSAFRHRVSKTLVPTSKQKFVHVAGQEMVPSQQFLLRAGMMRQSSSGIYSILPYGQRVLDKIEGIIDEELENIGCQKLSLPNLLTSENWKKTGRWESTGQEMFKVKDRKGSDFLLAPTHEEEVTTLIANEVQSYRQLPIRVYQVGRKFRDELRARSGLLRGKEFLMKDLYTFDASEADALKTYDEVVAAYRKIMLRLGVPYAVAEADTGNIGGTHSHEFHILSPVGEDSLLSCASCGYTSNEERAAGIIPLPTTSIKPKCIQFGILKTPSSSGDATQPEDLTAVVVALAADREVNDVKVKKALGKVELAATVEEIKAICGDTEVRKAMLCIDESITPGKKSSGPKDPQIQGVIDKLKAGLQFQEKGMESGTVYGDFHNCKPGDACPHCFESKGTTEPMELTRAIEIGHTFMLGTKYSQPLNAVFVPATNQTPEPIQMGCFGLGITRLLASIVEASHDRKGIIWPDAVAPFRVVIVTSEDESCVNVAENVYDVLQSALKSKSEVIIDDRTDTTLGFKMKDAELIGYPWMIVIGKGFLRTGNVEVQHRKTGQKWALEWPKIQLFFEERQL